MFMVCVWGDVAVRNGSGSHCFAVGGAKGRALLFLHSQICWSSGLRRSIGIVSWYRNSISTTLTVRVWDRYDVNALCAMPVL